jgi:hypothetical protein
LQIFLITVQDAHSIQLSRLRDPMVSYSFLLDVFRISAPHAACSAKPLPRRGRTCREFCADGIRRACAGIFLRHWVSLRYSGFTITDDFNDTSSHGDPLKGDSYVRICYDPSGNVILYLEIRLVPMRGLVTQRRCAASCASSRDYVIATP